VTRRGGVVPSASVSRRLRSPSSRCGYYQTEWPRRTRAYEYGVYTDQVLQNFFMPGMYVLTNLSPA